METIQQLIFGFGVTLQPTNLLCAFLGALMGTLVGVLPGLGPVGAMSMLLPVTYGMSPTGAIIMLAGIYYGCQYGGSTTSILVNIRPCGLSLFDRSSHCAAAITNSVRTMPG